MNKYGIAACVVLVAVVLSKLIGKPKLKYFTPSEFGAWYPLMSNELLKKLDKFRELMGSPVYVSTASGAIGRHGGSGDQSQHNIDMWGEVLAIDVFPTIKNEYVTTKEGRAIVYENARKAGFTGVGIYTDTSPGNLLHGDVRKDKTTSNPALWSRVGGQYLGINEVLA